MPDNETQTAEQDNPVTEEQFSPAAPVADDAGAAAPETPGEPAAQDQIAAVADHGDPLLQPLEDESAHAQARDLDMIMEIPVTLSVQLGQTRLTIRELLDLAKGSIVELDGLAGEPMDILINGYLIAHGEVVVVDEKYGIRITEIINRAERIHKLNQ